MRPEWIIAIFTIVYAVFTGWIIWEMRKDRKLLHKPILDATLKDAIYPDWLLFSVKNVGKGPALNCMFICKDDGESEWRLRETGMPIGSSESIDLKFEIVEKDYKKLGAVIWLEVDYTDIFGKGHKQRVHEGRQGVIVNTFGVSHKG